MPARRDNPFVPAWSEDQLDARYPPEMEAPYFDDHLRAWVLSRHADILAAFRASSLWPASPNEREAGELSADVERLKMRWETIEALSPAQLRAWRERIIPEVDERMNRLPTEEPVDLMDGYARPLC